MCGSHVADIVLVPQMSDRQVALNNIEAIAERAAILNALPLRGDASGCGRKLHNIRQGRLAPQMKEAALAIVRRVVGTAPEKAMVLSCLETCIEQSVQRHIEVAQSTALSRINNKRPAPEVADAEPYKIQHVGVVAPPPELDLSIGRHPENGAAAVPLVHFPASVMQPMSQAPSAGHSGPLPPPSSAVLSVPQASSFNGGAGHMLPGHVLAGSAFGGHQPGGAPGGAPVGAAFPSSAPLEIAQAGDAPQAGAHPAAVDAVFDAVVDNGAALVDSTFANGATLGSIVDDDGPASHQYAALAPSTIADEAEEADEMEADEAAETKLDPDDERPPMAHSAPDDLHCPPPHHDLGCSDGLPIATEATTDLPPPVMAEEGARVLPPPVMAEEGARVLPPPVMAEEGARVLPPSCLLFSEEPAAELAHVAELE
jgi:hypothetical protein